MTRIRRYFHNTGWRGGFLFLIILFIVGIFSFVLGDMVRGICLFLISFTGMSFFGDRLVDDPGKTEAGIRIFGTIIGLVAIALKKSPLQGHPLVPPVLVILVGIYLGCHFWFYSDDRIVVSR